MSMKLSWDQPDNMASLTCGKCGILFYVPTHWKENRIKGKTEEERTFYCPNGHGRVFQAGQSTEDKLRREAELLRQRLAEKDDTIKHFADVAEKERRRAAAQFGENTKLRKRVGNGTCPCCNRTFRQLAAHMADKHPDFKAEAAE
jgi:hypothetical protein